MPGKARRLAGVDLLDGVGGTRHRPGHRVERDLAALHAEQPELQRLNDAAQGRIAGQHLQQPLRLRQRRHLRLERIDRLEQQAVLGEKAAALRLLDGEDQILLLREPLRQRGGRLIDQFRRRRIDHRDDQFELRKRLLEGRLALPPVDMGRDQLVDVGRHGEMRRRIPARQDGKQKRHADHRPGMLRAKTDCADDKGSDHLHGEPSGAWGDGRTARVVDR